MDMEMKLIYHDLTDFYLNDLKVINIHITNNGSDFNIGSNTPYFALKHLQTGTVVNSFPFSVTSALGGTAVFTVTPSAINSVGYYKYEIGMDYGTPNEVITTGFINIKTRIV
jgi:hypothetical protein